MYYIIYFLLSINLIFMQGMNSSGFQMPGSGIILGEVINEETGQPVEYASVTLIDYDSKDVINGQLTDYNGIFVFKEVKNGQYFIEIKDIKIEININTIFISKEKKFKNIKYDENWKFTVF